VVRRSRSGDARFEGSPRRSSPNRERWLAASEPAQDLGLTGPELRRTVAASYGLRASTVAAVAFVAYAASGRSAVARAVPLAAGSCTHDRLAI
jgi:hypothetical protein